MQLPTADSGAALNRRVLIIDDNEAIHADFRKILTPQPTVSTELLRAEQALFGSAPPQLPRTHFELVTASQGQQGYQEVVRAHAAGRPFAMAFVDMRMPPGWDGLQTIEAIWRDFPDIEMVICTAFSDYSWEETIQRLGQTDRLLIVKKPFDHVEILQVACALTRKWNLQQQTGALMGHLSELVRERTAELERAHDDLLRANAELRAARDAAETASRAKTMFLANVSHELRTPMTAIAGYVQELVERRGAGDESFEGAALATIARSADHLALLIDDLLEFATFDHDALVIMPAASDPRSLLDETVSRVHERARSRGIAFTAQHLGDLPAAIVTDPTRVRQILVHLADNAIKFTERGSVTIELRYDATAQQLLVEVADTGIGIATEALERIFLPLQQADESTTRRYGGTGLGLATARQLARRLGGDITVSSKVGAGSCFRLSIPAEPVAPPTNAAPRSTAAVDSARPELHARILIVEDGRDNQRLIEHLLRKAGCHTEVVENGQQCVDRMAAPDAPFDLVLMDVQMPVMGGLEATQILRERGCRVPIVALTASAGPQSELACRKAGCDAFLKKPIHRATFYRTLAEQLRR